MIGCYLAFQMPTLSNERNLRNFNAYNITFY